MGKDRECGVYRCIRKFESLVIRTWDHDLNPRSFINRKDRKTIRNVFRYFIHYSCDEDLIHGVQSQLLYPKSLDNYFLGELIRYNDHGLKKLYNKIDMSNDRMPDISTKGKYIVYFVIYLLYMGNNNIKFKYSDSGRMVSKKVADIVTDYLRLVCSVHTRFGCKCMFIGLPTYYVYLMSADDIIMAIESISEKPMSGPEEYERGNTIHINEMCAHRDFFNFIIASKKASNKGLRISLCGIPFETDYSISELIMDALCYCFTDEVSIKKGRYEYAQLYTKCYIGDTYEYIRLTDEHPTSKMSFSSNCDHDCSAIRLYKDKDNDFYQNRNMLFFPDNCSKWKWYLDEDKYPSYDYNNDKERRPRDYHEFYIDNTECDQRKNCPKKTNEDNNVDEDDYLRDEADDYEDENYVEEEDIIRDEAPVVNRGLLCRRHGRAHRKHSREDGRYKYDIYEDERPRNKKQWSRDDRVADSSKKDKLPEDTIVPRRAQNLEDAKEFEDEMVQAMHDDDYTPKSIRRRNRYLLQEDKYYYDRGHPYLMSEKRYPGDDKYNYKPHPDKDRENYDERKPRSNQERYDDAVDTLRRLEKNNFKDNYKKIKEKMDRLEDEYEDLRKSAIELPKKLDKQTDNGPSRQDDDRSWF